MPDPAGPPPRNLDQWTIDGFGDEWDLFDQSQLSHDENLRLFDQYFSVFPFAALGPDSQGFDLGCGSGRWARLMAPRVGHLHCIDPAEKALAVARSNLAGIGNVTFHRATSAEIPLADASQDFGYSLGVLHHIPDTAAALRDCVRKLKPGAPFLLYLYYAFDNRPAWFRAVWRASELLRGVISARSFTTRRVAAAAIALTVYWPLARLARAADWLGMNVANWPLSAYRSLSFYTMRTDALDRFGTRLEQRFSRDQIAAMMRQSGLGSIEFRDDVPFWVACGRREA